MMSPRRRLQERGFDAVVTSSRTARGLIAALSWIASGPNVSLRRVAGAAISHLEASYRPVRLATAPRLEIARILGDFSPLGLYSSPKASKSRAVTEDGRSASEFTVADADME